MDVSHGQVLKDRRRGLQSTASKASLVPAAIPIIDAACAPSRSEMGSTPYLEHQFGVVQQLKNAPSYAHLGAQVRDLASELTANAGVMTDESADQGLGKNAPVGNTWMVLRTSYEQRTAWIAAKHNSRAWLHVPHWQSLAGPESTRWRSLKRQKKTFRPKTYYQADVSVRLSDDLTTPGGDTNEGTLITDIMFW